MLEKDTPTQNTTKKLRLKVKFSHISIFSLYSFSYLNSCCPVTIALLHHLSQFTIHKKNFSRTPSSFSTQFNRPLTFQLSGSQKCWIVRSKIALFTSNPFAFPKKKLRKHVYDIVSYRFHFIRINFKDNFGRTIIYFLM